MFSSLNFRRQRRKTTVLNLERDEGEELIDGEMEGVN